MLDIWLLFELNSLRPNQEMKMNMTIDHLSINLFLLLTTIISFKLFNFLPCDWLFDDSQPNISTYQTSFDLVARRE